jgi:hypothetical protein
MSATKITIHSTGAGVCSLTQKEGDGLTVSFDDGTVKESFLSWKAFRQLLGMKVTQRTASGWTKGETRTEASSHTGKDGVTETRSEGKTVGVSISGNSPVK